jgi:hypothetical protein
MTILLRLGIDFVEEKLSASVRFIHRMWFSVFVMAITTAQMSGMVV